MSSIYPYLPTPSTPSTAGSPKSYTVSSLLGEAATPKPPQSPLITTYPFKTPTQQPQGITVFSPWSPLQNGLITGLPTPPSNDSLINKEFTNAAELTPQHTPKAISRCDSSQKYDHRTGSNEQERNSTLLPAFSPYTPRVSSVQSPFIYMYNHSPLSPMVLLGSPCAPSSVKSVPSVNSSSGCSSMSEGSVLSVEKMSSNLPRIAPTEYHVGIKPSSQTILIEDGCGSDGVTTPTPDSDDDEIGDVDVEKVESCSNIRNSNSGDNYFTQPTVITNTAATSYKPATTSDCYPLSHSVQSLISDKFQV